MLGRSAPVAALLAATIVVASLPATAQVAPTEWVVGYRGAPTATASAYGVVVAESPHLGFRVIETSAPTAMLAALARDPGISYVHPNGPTFALSASWDSASWDQTTTDSAGWDSAGWDAAGWDSAGWDATAWQSAGWDSAGWDSAGWDSAGWDASGWDSASWDSAGWDSAGWDSAGWDSAGWDGAGWDAAGWDAAKYGADALTAAGSTFTGGNGDPLRDRQWGLRALNASGAFHGFKAKNTQTICIVDTGVDHAHPDLASRMVRAPVTGYVGYDFVNGDPDPMDDAGHGTHVAGIAAAAINNGLGITGFSSERLLAVKVLDARGVGTEADLALGIEWCVDHGASVISMSLGTTEDVAAVRTAVQYAHANGVAMVASMGNQGGCGCPRFPAGYGEVVAVGALRPDGRVPAFSSISTAVDFGAPGVAIVSTWPGGRYAALNGTSMATPHVAGALGLLLDAQPALNATAATRILASTAVDLGPAGKDPYVGYGAINMGRALDKAMATERAKTG